MKLEDHIPNLDVPESFYRVFKEEFFAVPYLMDQNLKWPEATMWKTAIKNGGISVMNKVRNNIYGRKISLYH